MLRGFCGFRLNTAGVVIGWIGAALSLLTIVLLSISIDSINEWAETIANQMNDPNLDVDTIRRAILVIICAYITLNAINLAASAMLIVGTVKERHLLLVPWLLNSGLSLLFGSAYGLYIVITAIATAAPFGSVAVSLISIGFSLVFQFYIWYAIYSLYKEIQSNSDTRSRLLPTTSSSYPSYTKI